MYVVQIENSAPTMSYTANIGKEEKVGKNSSDLTRQVWLVRRVLSAQDNSQANNSLGTFRGGFSE